MSLVAHAAKEWKALPSRTRERLRITLIDQVAAKKKESLCLGYSQLQKACDLVPLQMDIGSPDFEHADFLFDSHKKCEVTSVFICLDNDSLSLSAALAICQAVRERKTPLYNKEEKWPIER